MIKNLRKTKEWSLKETAKLLGISESFLSQIENNKRKPSLELIKAIANLFECNADEIAISVGSTPKWIAEKMMAEPKLMLTAAMDEFQKYEKQKK